MRATSPAQKEDDAAAIVTTRVFLTLRGWYRTVRAAAAAGGAARFTEVFLTAILIAIAMVPGANKGFDKSIPGTWGRGG